MKPARKRPAPTSAHQPIDAPPLVFGIDGPPHPKERVRVVRTKTGKVVRYTPIKTKRYERAVRNAAGWAAISYRTPAQEWQTTGRYRVEVYAHFGDARRRDVDNVAKSVLDACNGVLWRDDSQVASLTVNRAIDRERPRTEVRVEVLP